MSWSIGWDPTWKRDIGYGVPAYCDHPGCKVVIDRGLSHVCADQQPYGGEDGCGLYFCAEHLSGGKCQQCWEGRLPFMAKRDHPTWMRHQLTDHSWARWRAANPKEAKRLRAELRESP